MLNAVERNKLMFSPADVRAAFSGPPYALAKPLHIPEPLATGILQVFTMRFHITEFDLGGCSVVPLHEDTQRGRKAYSIILNRNTSCKLHFGSHAFNFLCQPFGGGKQKAGTCQ